MKLALVHLFQIHLQILTDSAALVIHQLEYTQREHRMSVVFLTNLFINHIQRHISIYIYTVESLLLLLFYY